VRLEESVREIHETARNEDNARRDELVSSIISQGLRETPNAQRPTPNIQLLAVWIRRSTFDVRRSVFASEFEEEKGAPVSESALHIEMAISRILSG